MKFEQEKNKINKLWEKSQKNKEELEKKKNDSLIVAPNNFKKQSKQLIVPVSLIQTPYYYGKVDAFMKTAISNFCVDYMFYSSQDYFKSSHKYINFILNGLDKRVICSDFYINWGEWNEFIYYGLGNMVSRHYQPLYNTNYTCIQANIGIEPGSIGSEYYWQLQGSPNEYRLYFLDDEEVYNKLTYGTSYTLIARPWTGIRWGLWGAPFNFYIYPYYPPLPDETLYYNLPSDSYRQTYEPNHWISNIFHFSTDSPPPTDSPPGGYELALSYPDLYQAVHWLEACEWHKEIYHHTSDTSTSILFYLYCNNVKGFASLDVIASPLGITASVSASAPDVEGAWAGARVVIPGLGYVDVLASQGETMSNSKFFPPITRSYIIHYHD